MTNSRENNIQIVPDAIRRLKYRSILVSEDEQFDNICFPKGGKRDQFNKDINTLIEEVDRLTGTHKLDKVNATDNIGFVPWGRMDYGHMRSPAQCPLGENCDLTIAYMKGVADERDRMKDTPVNVGNIILQGTMAYNTNDYIVVEKVKSEAVQKTIDRIDDRIQLMKDVIKGGEEIKLPPELHDYHELSQEENKDELKDYETILAALRSFNPPVQQSAVDGEIKAALGWLDIFMSGDQIDVSYWLECHEPAIRKALLAGSNKEGA
jgi:hypothetical protein